MQPIAKALSNAEVNVLAAYYAGLPAPTPTPESGDAALITKGKTLAMSGDWNHDIPACFQCHGVNGQGIGSDFPAITGQSALYIANQIAAWKSGTRKNDPDGLMKAVASRLSADQVKAVSTFLANQPLTTGTSK